MPLTNEQTTALEQIYHKALEFGETEPLITYLNHLLNNQDNTITKTELWNSIQFLYRLMDFQTYTYFKSVKEKLIRYCIDQDLNNGAHQAKPDLSQKTYPYYQLMPVSTFLEKGGSRASFMFSTAEKNPNGIIPLHGAVLLGNRGTVDRLLKENTAQASMINENGETPLHLAFSTGDSTMISTLVKANADMLFAKDISQKLPIHHALCHNNFTILKTYLNIIYSQISLLDKFLLLHLALENSKIEALNQLLEILIQREGEAVKNILNYTDNQYNPLLFTACICHCDINTIKSLFNAGANINLCSQKLDRTLINIQGTISSIRSPSGLHPLHGACIDQSIEIVRFFLENKVHVHVKTSESSTALHMATMHNQSEMVDLLLSHGAETDILAEDVIHDTPFYIALSSAMEKRDSKILITFLESPSLKNHKKSVTDHINCVLSGIDNTTPSSPYMQNLITLLSDYINQMNAPIVNTDLTKKSTKRKKHKKKAKSTHVDQETHVDTQDKDEKEAPDEDKENALDNAILADLAHMSLDTTIVATDAIMNSSLISECPTLPTIAEPIVTHIPEIEKTIVLDHENKKNIEILIKEKAPKKIRRILEKIQLLENSIEQYQTIDDLEKNILCPLENFRTKDKNNPTKEITDKIEYVEQIALQKKEILLIQLIQVILDKTIQKIEINIQNELEILSTVSDHSAHTDNTDNSDISTITFQNNNTISENSSTPSSDIDTLSPITTTNNSFATTLEKRMHSNSTVSDVSLTSTAFIQNSDFITKAIHLNPKCLEHPLWNESLYQISRALKSEKKTDYSTIEKCLKFRSYGSSNYKINPNDLDIAVFELNDNEWISWKQCVNESNDTKNLAILHHIPFIGNIIKNGGKATAGYPKKGKYEALIIKTSLEIYGRNIAIDFNILPPGMTMEVHAYLLDFSIGAMYYDLQEKLMYCPIPNTLQHLEQRILWPIRNPVDLFQEDPSIMLRAMRMIAQTRSTQQCFRLSDEAIQGWQIVSTNNPSLLNMIFDGRNAFQASDKCYNEMVLLFSRGYAFNTLNVLDEHGLLPLFFNYVNYLSEPQRQETFYLMTAVAKLIDNSEKIISPSLMYYAAHWSGIQLMNAQMGNLTGYNVLSLSNGSINIFREETNYNCSFDIIHQGNLQTLFNLVTLLRQKQAQAAMIAEQAGINAIDMNQLAWKKPSDNAVSYGKNNHGLHKNHKSRYHHNVQITCNTNHTHPLK